MANKPLKQSAKSNPTALGDPVSLKAEKSNISPTEKDKGNNQSVPNPGFQPQQTPHRSLKERAEQDLGEAKKGNRSMLGDPVSLKAETSERDPVWDSEENEDGTGRSGGRRGKERESKL